MKSQPPQPGADQIKVLLVDDHDHVLWGLRKLIEGEWPHMAVAGTVKTMNDAVTAVQDCRVDVVVLDVYLGETNSLDRISELVFDNGPAVMILTASHDPQLGQRAKESGVRSVILKDAPAEVLLTEIERVCSCNRPATTETENEGFAGKRSV